ncbi:uncharacterized protein SEPMUDRAFT_111768 [Sphaerulina musiva SO2202]|uniref:Uncharacterized protein n=1 Tax=Sphaerulina musiva (strain SO2202) TaxID=692275 RepID=M3CWC0_SPHMS|nr:uncharacterized protein SEPMUDRAFT_111768 [Sphaerulina musiva SO2202]EMF08417.1 hypothetical protein SEPMUDRAFT_111768 [Sphaerulina musiva SO2202]
MPKIGLASSLPNRISFGSSLSFLIIARLKIRVRFALLAARTGPFLDRNHGFSTFEFVTERASLDAFVVTTLDSNLRKPQSYLQRTFGIDVLSGTTRLSRSALAPPKTRQACSQGSPMTDLSPIAPAVQGEEYPPPQALWRLKSASAAMNKADKGDTGLDDEMTWLKRYIIILRKSRMVSQIICKTSPLPLHHSQHKPHSTSIDFFSYIGTEHYAKRIRPQMLTPTDFDLEKDDRADPFYWICFTTT